MSICVIPARGGSKRIPRKNIRSFFGRPIISWPISAARDAGCFDRIIVSTDDAEIAEIAREAGAEVPFLRSAELSNDRTATAPVIADAIAQIGTAADAPVCCLYPTAPFVQPQDLSAGLAMLVESAARFVVSVTTFPFPIQRALHRNPAGAIGMIDPSKMHTRSQDLEEAWHDAGQFYWARAEDWQVPEIGIFSEGAFGLPLPRFRVQDIDTEEDWVRAEYLMSMLQADSKGLHIS